MPTISRPRLAIAVDGSSTSNVILDYTINFDELDRTLNLEFTEMVQLFGADSGATGGDDRISGGLLRDGLVRPNGQASVTRHVERRVSNNALDEDDGVFGVGEGDEIYARVRLDATSPLFPQAIITRNSNEVSGRF